jgi:hypothetical protein
MVANRSKPVLSDADVRAAAVLSDQIYWGSLRPAAFPISGSSHRFLEQTQGETRRPGTLSIQLPA